jgi:signal transduction histidine kinase
MKKKAKYLFWIIAFYILLQFTWWEVLLVKQTADLIEAKKSIIALQGVDAASLDSEILSLEKKKMIRIYMMVGEGTVFLIFISIGIARVYNTFRKENQILTNQKNFLLAITHELKTPLASIKLNLQTLLKHNDIDLVKRQSLLLNSVNDTDRLNQLVEKVLLSSQLNSGNLPVNFQRSCLSEHLMNSINQYFNMSADRLNLNIQPNIEFSFDGFMFTSIWTNLIENALKYSGKEKIDVSLTSVESKILFYVADKGPGIPPEEKENVFEMFYRVDKESHRSSKGTGLGLYIVKRIVNLHGGIIYIESGNPGARFVVELPNP